VENARLHQELGGELVEQSYCDIHGRTGPRTESVCDGLERLAVIGVTDQRHLDLKMAGIDRVRAFGAAWTIGVQRAEILRWRRVEEIKHAFVNFGFRGARGFLARSHTEACRSQETE